MQRSRFWRPGTGRDIFRTGWSPSMPATPSHPLHPAGEGQNEVRLRCLRSQVPLTFPPATSAGHHCHPYIDRREALAPEIYREGGKDANYLGPLPAEPLREQSFLAPIWSSSILIAHGNDESCFIRCCENQLMYLYKILSMMPSMHSPGEGWNAPNMGLRRGL